MRLRYNKSAPLDYEPDHFQNKMNDSQQFQFLFKKKPKKRDIGNIRTKYHSASLHVKSLDRHYKNSDDEDQSSSEEEEQENEVDQNNEFEMDPFQTGNSSNDDEPEIIDATSSLTMKSKQNRPIQFKNHVEINPDSSNSSSDSSESSKSSTSSTTQSHSGSKINVIPSLENSTNPINKTHQKNQVSIRSSTDNDSKSENKNSNQNREKNRNKHRNQSDIESENEYERNKNNKIKKENEKQDNNQDSEKEKDKKRNRKRKRALQESQDNEQDININVNQNDKNKKRKKKDKKRVSVSRKTKMNKKILWKKGDIALRNGERVEITKCYEEDNCYDVRKPNGKIVNTTWDKLQKIDSSDIDEEVDENDDYQEPPKKRQKLNSNSSDYGEIGDDETDDIDIHEMMEFIINNGYGDNDALNQKKMEREFGCDCNYILDELVDLKILSKDKKTGKYKTRRNYKRKFKQITKSHIVENDRTKYNDSHYYN